MQASIYEYQYVTKRNEGVNTAIYVILSLPYEKRYHLFRMLEENESPNQINKPLRIITYHNEPRYLLEIGETNFSGEAILEVYKHRDALKTVFNIISEYEHEEVV